MTEIILMNMELDETQNNVREYVKRCIQDYLKENKLTPAKLALKLNKSRSVVAAWLNTKEGHNFSLDTLVELQFNGIIVLSFDLLPLNKRLYNSGNRSVSEFRSGILQELNRKKIN